MFSSPRAPFIAAFLLIILLAGLSLGYLQSREPPQVRSQGTGPTIAEFRLTDQFGKNVTKRDVLGKPALLFFGFTFCPDVCPTTLASMTAHLKSLGEDADRLNVFFVTVDPERDTPEVLKSYLSSFDSRIRGLTGSMPQVQSLTKSLGIYHAKVDTGNGSYSIDHSAIVVQLDSEGVFFGTIAFDESPEAALSKLKRLVKDGVR